MSNPAADPLKDLDRSIGYPVGEQEIVQRRALGDKRFDEIIAATDARDEAVTGYWRAKAGLFDALAVLVVVGTLALVAGVILLAVR